MDPVTRTLAQCLVDSRPEDVPAAVVHHAKRSLVNWFGCVLGGCRDRSVQSLLDALGPDSGPARATVLGLGRRVDVGLAALANAVSGNILDFDDTHARMVLHPSGPVASALVAWAEATPVSGRDLLHAFVLGVEVEARILDPRAADYKFAWSPTTTVGAFGAAAAVGRLLGLDGRQMASALGLAASQACGLRETGGSMAKSFNPGHVARCGITAARLAANGFTGPQAALEGPNGFLTAFGVARDPASIVRDWGREWEVSCNTFKAFPCGIVTHAAIDACMQVKARHGLDADEIAGATLTVHPVALRLTGRRRPGSPLEAKLSVFHCAAAALVHGRVGVKQFADECIADPRVVRLRDAMEGREDATLATDAARVEVRMRSGAVFRFAVEHAVGSAARPMTDADLDAKLRGLAEDVLPAAQCDLLLERLWKFDAMDDAGALAGLACAAVHPPSQCR